MKLCHDTFYNGSEFGFSRVHIVRDPDGVRPSTWCDAVAGKMWNANGEGDRRT